MNVSIVIPNYNGEGLLKKNLPKVFDAIFSYKNGRAELVVIDDCSLDNSINLLKRLKLEFESKYPQIKFAINIF